jgi:hypothetical protein
VDAAACGKRKDCISSDKLLVSVCPGSGQSHAYCAHEFGRHGPGLGTCLSSLFSGHQGLGSVRAIPGWHTMGVAISMLGHSEALWETLDQAFVVQFGWRCGELH